MLYNGVNHFNWSINNYGDDVPGANGTSLAADAVAHTKGTDTALFAGVAYDVWGISIVLTNGNTDATIRRQMIDLLIDPAAGVGNAGSSWSVLINNIYSCGPSKASGSTGVHYYFPLFVPAGTAIGARVQDVVGAATCRISVTLVGQPTRPDLVKVGHKVQTIGATTASTSGVAVTPGTSAWGSYTASMGTLTNDAWWWQFGIGSSDTSMGAIIYRWDVAHDATAKYTCIKNIISSTTSTTGEVMLKNSIGDGLPIRHAPAGTDVYVRGYALGTPDSNFTTVVYAVT